MDEQEKASQPYTVAYEDSNLLIVTKAQGLATAPGYLPSLCEILFRQRPGLGEVHGYKKQEGGLLNRLDNETGGLVLFARTDAAFSVYSGMMAEGKIEKKYLAVARGKLDPGQGVIDMPVGHSRKSKRRMVANSGKQKIRGRWQQAQTHFRTIETRGSYSLIELTITRGVRHQIRVHLQALGCPVSGDKLYAADNTGFSYPYHLLYAYSLQFVNPHGKEIRVQVDVPFLELWKRIPE